MLSKTFQIKVQYGINYTVYACCLFGIKQWHSQDTEVAWAQEFHTATGSA